MFYFVLEKAFWIRRRKTRGGRARGLVCTFLVYACASGFLRASFLPACDGDHDGDQWDETTYTTQAYIPLVLPLSLPLKQTGAHQGRF